MGGSTSNSAELIQSAANNFMSMNVNDCFAQDNTLIKNTNTIIANSRVGNYTGVKVAGRMNASCSINQQIVQTATNILVAQATQIAKTASDLFNDGVIYKKDSNSASVLQSIINNITSVTSNTCNAQVSTEVDNTNTVVYGSSVNNLTGVDVSSNPNASCAISNMSKQDAYNRQQGGLQQTAKSVGMFVMIALAIMGCLIIGLIIIVVIFAAGGAGIFILGSKKPAPAAPSSEGGEDKETKLETEEAFLKALTS